jgi:hypothetical protein
MNARIEELEYRIAREQEIIKKAIAIKAPALFIKDARRSLRNFKTELASVKVGA